MIRTMFLYMTLISATISLWYGECQSSGSDDPVLLRGDTAAHCTIVSFPVETVTKDLAKKISDSGSFGRMKSIPALPVSRDVLFGLASGIIDTCNMVNCLYSRFVL